MAADAIFPVTEFQTRCAALQDGMAKAGLSALLLTTPADLFYVTGFLTRFFESPTRPWFVVVPQSGDPIAVIPSIGTALMAQSWVADIRTWDAPAPGHDGVGLLADTLCEVVPDAGQIGLPMGRESHLRMPLGDFEDLKTRVGTRRLSPDAGIMAQARAIKSPAEVARIRASCEIAGRAFARVPQIAGDGVPVSDVFRGFQGLLLQEGADWVSYLAGGAGPGGYGDVISPASDAPLVAGDVLMLDTGAVRSGYFCDFDRNFSVGPPEAPVAEAHRALVGATDHALNQMRPGLRACDVHQMMATHLEAAGQTVLGGRLGHGLGIHLTEGLSFLPWDDAVLEAGMVLTLEPGVEVSPGRILVHEENLVLHGDGAELLSPRAPEEMVQI